MSPSLNRLGVVPSPGGAVVGVLRYFYIEDSLPYIIIGINNYLFECYFGNHFPTLFTNWP